MLVFEGREKPEYPEKTSRSKGENQQQTQPTYGVDAGIWTGATLVGGERSHHSHPFPYVKIMKQEGLYQNKVNSSLVCTGNCKWTILIVEENIWC